MRCAQRPTVEIKMLHPKHGGCAGLQVLQGSANGLGNARQHATDGQGKASAEQAGATKLPPAPACNQGVRDHTLPISPVCQPTGRHATAASARSLLGYIATALFLDFFFFFIPHQSLTPDPSHRLILHLLPVACEPNRFYKHHQVELSFQQDTV